MLEILQGGEISWFVVHVEPADQLHARYHTQTIDLHRESMVSAGPIA